LARAELHAESEIAAKDDKSYGRLEEEARTRRDLLSNALQAIPGDTTLQAQLRDCERILKEVRGIRDRQAQIAAYHAQLKRKYLQAAEHPEKPVEADPPPPW
jgi:hypothetical protein